MSSNVEIEMKWLLTTIGTLFVVAAASVLWMISSFCPYSGSCAMASDFEDLSWSVQRSNIRGIEKDLRAEDDPGAKKDLEEDLEEELELFCRDFPDDRKCDE